MCIAHWITPIYFILNKHIGSNRNQYQGGIGGTIYSYAVDDDGTINFPILGRIKVEGLTRLEVEQLLCDKLKPYLAETENPIVTVRINSFHFTILGEVGSPGVKTSAREKCSLLDAIAMSGDIGIQGKRDNIMLIREAADGGKSVHHLAVRPPRLRRLRGGLPGKGRGPYRNGGGYRRRDRRPPAF